MAMEGGQRAEDAEESLVRPMASKKRKSNAEEIDPPSKKQNRNAPKRIKPLSVVMNPPCERCALRADEQCIGYPGRACDTCHRRKLRCNHQTRINRFPLPTTGTIGAPRAMSKSVIDERAVREQSRGGKVLGKTSPHQSRGLYPVPDAIIPVMARDKQEPPDQYPEKTGACNKMESEPSTSRYSSHPSSSTKTPPQGATPDRPTENAPAAAVPHNLGKPSAFTTQNAPTDIVAGCASSLPHCCNALVKSHLDIFYLQIRNLLNGSETHSQLNNPLESKMLCDKLGERLVESFSISFQGMTSPETSFGCLAHNESVAYDLYYNPWASEVGMGG